MTYSRISRWIAIPAIAMAVAVAAGADQTPKSSSTALLGVSKPSDDRSLSFEHPGLVQEVLVKENEQVKANQLVARENDDEEQAALKIDKDKADDETSINAEITVRDQKQVAYDKMKESAGAVGKIELDSARVDVAVADARIELARHQHLQDQLKYQQTLIAIEQLKLSSPIDGVVADIFLKGGEASGNNTPVLRVIQIDPLWVEVPVPIVQANRLKEGDAATITFPDPNIGQRAGKIKLIKPYGDSGSQRRVVRVEMPNPEKLAPNEIVTVDFSAAGLAKN